MGNNSMFAVAFATDGKTAGWLPESYGFLRIHKVNIYYAMAEYQVVWPNAELWRGYYNAGDDGLKWSGWQPIATAIKPQEFSLPLAEGVTTVGAGYKNIYSKDQFGIVRVWFSVHFESIPASGTHVFNLPEGFRPDSICCAAAVLSMVEYYNATVAIHPSGAAIVDHGTIGQTGPINLHGCIEFPAD